MLNMVLGGISHKAFISKQLSILHSAFVMARMMIGIVLYLKEMFPPLVSFDLFDMFLDACTPNR